MYYYTVGQTFAGGVVYMIYLGREGGGEGGREGGREGGGREGGREAG